MRLATEHLTGAATEPIEARQCAGLLKEYRGHLQACGFSACTQWNYTQAIRLLLVTFPDTRLGQFTPVHIDRHLAARPLSTQYQEFIRLRAFFVWLNERGVVRGNPCVGARRPPKTGGRPAGATPVPAAEPSATPEQTRRGIKPRLRRFWSVTPGKCAVAGPLAALLADYDDYLTRQETLGRYGRRTRRDYLAVLRRFCQHYPTLKPEHVSAEHIERYLVSLPISPRSMQTVLMRLRTFFRWLVRDQRLLRENPCAHVERPKWSPTFRPAVSPREFLALCHACRTLEEVVLLETLYHTGLRVREFQRMRVGDIDVTARRIRVVGKGRRQDVVLFLPHVADLLRAWTDGRPAEAWVFSGPRLAQRRVEWIEGVLHRLGRDAGLAYHLTAHLLRHGFARALKLSDAPLAVIQRLVRHQNIQTTINMYGRLDLDDLQQVYDRTMGGERR